MQLSGEIFINLADLPHIKRDNLFQSLCASIALQNSLWLEEMHAKL